MIGEVDHAKRGGGFVCRTHGAGYVYGRQAWKPAPGFPELNADVALSGWCPGPAWSHDSGMPLATVEA